MAFSSLPTDVLRYLSQYLTWIDLYHLAQSNKRLRKLFFNPYLEVDNNIDPYIRGLIHFGYADLLQKYSTKFLFNNSTYIEAFAASDTPIFHLRYRDNLVQQNEYLTGIIKFQNDTAFDLNCKFISKLNETQGNVIIIWPHSLSDFVLMFGSTNMCRYALSIKLINTDRFTAMASKACYRGPDYLRVIQEGRIDISQFKSQLIDRLTNTLADEERYYPWYIQERGTQTNQRIFQASIDWLNAN